jgi:hypothetical protein
MALARLEMMLVCVKLLGAFSFQLPGAGADPKAKMASVLSQLVTQITIKGAPGSFTFEWAARAPVVLG